MTSDGVKALKATFATDPSPFPILSDPKGTAFAKYGCLAGSGFLHGTFLLDANHKVVWRTVGSSPYLAVSELLRLAPPSRAASAQALHASLTRYVSR